MAKSFREGDKVSWSSPVGKTTGTVVEKLTRKTEVAGRQVAT